MSELRSDKIIIMKFISNMYTNREVLKIACELGVTVKGTFEVLMMTCVNEARLETMPMKQTSPPMHKLNFWLRVGIFEA